MASKLVKRTTPVARVEHTCYHCGRTINKGEKYLNNLYVTDGRIDRHYLHLSCEDEKPQLKQEMITRIPRMYQPLVTEAQFRQKVKDETAEMLQLFTFEENIKIAIVPLIITELVWAYVEKALAYCAKHKVSETVKLSRAVKMVRQEYLKSLEKDLPRRNINNIISESQRVLEHCSHTFCLLWLQIDQCIKDQWVKTSHIELAIDVKIALLLLGLLDENEKKVKDLIMSKTGNYTSVANPKIEALRESLKAYDRFEVEYSDHVSSCIKVIGIKIDQLDFNVV